jgi:uncharacterized protein YheU (UPF0270 family)
MAGHEAANKQPVIVPAERLSSEALSGLIEEFVTRSGTDYGMREATLAEKCSAIRKQLASGRVVIICDPCSQTCNIVSAEDIQTPGKGTP